MLLVSHLLRAEGIEVNREDVSSHYPIWEYAKPDPNFQVAKIAIYGIF